MGHSWLRDKRGICLLLGLLHSVTVKYNCNCWVNKLLLPLKLPFGAREFAVSAAGVFPPPK